MEFSKEWALVNDLLCHLAGYHLEIFGLSVYGLENGRYCIDHIDHDYYRTYSNAMDAAYAFVDRRREYKLGIE